MDPELDRPDQAADAMPSEVDSPEQPESRDRSRTIIAAQLPDLEHYNIPSQRRTELISEFAGVIGKTTIAATLWALLQVCAIEKLEAMIRVARESPEYITYVAETAQFIPEYWKQQIRDRGSTTSSNDSTPNKRVKTARLKSPKDRAKERDNDLCVLTKEWPIEVAHIYPHCLISSGYPRRVPRFWGALSLFWPPEIISLWRQAIFRDPNDPTKAVDHCANLLCLANQVHAMWGNGLFAIRPLDYYDEMKKLDIEIYWQTNQGHTIDDDVLITNRPVSSINLSEYSRSDGSPSSRLVVGNRTIKSGDRHTLQTTDPVNHPLPDRYLLEMQWHLNRVVALSGASEAVELVLDDTDDEAEGSAFVEHWRQAVRTETPMSDPMSDSARRPSNPRPRR